jgi:Tol biopolymer transport system component
MGIFDLFMANLDGSDLRQLTFGGVQEFPAGWLADGSLLYSVPGQEYEYTVYRLDLQSGESQVFSSENIQSISPDGQYVAIAEMTFGERWQIVISELDGDNRRSLVDGSLSVLNPIWSPDGQWILASVSDTGVEASMGALINLSTCEAIPLPGLKEDIIAWAP